MTIDYFWLSLTRNTTDSCNDSCHWKVLICESHQRNGQLFFFSLEKCSCAKSINAQYTWLFGGKDSTCETNRRNIQVLLSVQNVAFAKSSHAPCLWLRPLKSCQMRYCSQQRTTHVTSNVFASVIRYLHTRSYANIKSCLNRAPFHLKNWSNIEYKFTQTAPTLNVVISNRFLNDFGSQNEVLGASKGRQNIYVKLHRRQLPPPRPFRKASSCIHVSPHNSKKAPAGLSRPRRRSENARKPLQRALTKRLNWLAEDVEACFLDHNANVQHTIRIRMIFTPPRDHWSRIQHNKSSLAKWS